MQALFIIATFCLPVDSLSLLFALAGLNMQTIGNEMSPRVSLINLLERVGRPVLRE